MPLFFFISGYLTKKELLNVGFIKKYFRKLIIPYLFFNLIFYPYWLIRFLNDVGSFNWFNGLFKPVVGTLLLQIDTCISEPLNGVTWFIAALLIMKFTLAICNNYPKSNFILFASGIIFTILYIINEDYLFTKSLTIIGFMRCYPFFLLGYSSKLQSIHGPANKKYYIIYSVCGICLSIIAFFVNKQTDNLIYYGICFWIICICAIVGIISFCKLFDHYNNKIIINISDATIVIMGLHWMLIGTSNYLISKFFSIEEIFYPYYIAIILTIAYITLLYPILILLKNKLPYLIGR